MPRTPECDWAVVKLRELVIGLPAYHPLQKDADQKLDALKRAFDSYRNGFRRVTPLEAKFLGEFPWESRYIPDIPQLGRPATEKDVEDGKAIFHLDGKRKLAKLQLPAVASHKVWKNRYGPKLLIIVQTEIDDDGKIFYGVTGNGKGRIARPEELSNIKPIK